MNEAEIKALKAALRCLARTHRDFPSEETRADMATLEEMLINLGGESRTGAHRIISGIGEGS